MEHKISDQSPIGKALMGARAGDTVVIEVPYGTIHMEIKDVTRTPKAED